MCLSYDYPPWASSAQSRQWLHPGTALILAEQMGFSQSWLQATSGAAVYVDSRHAIAHNMVTVLDGKAVVTGRFNFTKGQRRRMRRTANHRLTLAVDLTILADIGRTTASRFTRLVSLPKANTQPKRASLFARQKERLPEGSLFHIAATVRQFIPVTGGL